MASELMWSVNIYEHRYNGVLEVAESESGVEKAKICHALLLGEISDLMNSWGISHDLLRFRRIYTIVK